MDEKRKVNYKQYKCVNCDGEIPKKRINALLMLGTPTHQWTHVQCSTEKKKLGIYTGLPGVSELLIVDKIYEDSVRDIFNKPDDNESEDNDEKPI